MNKVKITIKKITTYDYLIKEYENTLDNPCDMVLGKTFVSVDGIKPLGFCNSAWETIYPFVLELANGGGNFYDGWMKNEKTAMISCNDGFRPVSFLLEII